jgi:hypothetical protein
MEVNLLAYHQDYFLTHQELVIMNFLGFPRSWLMVLKDFTGSESN